MNAAQTKKAFLNHFWEAGELLYDSIIQQRQTATPTARAGNKPGATRRKASGTTQRGRRSNTPAAGALAP